MKSFFLILSFCIAPIFLNAQNISFETTKKLDEFTKSLNVSVFPMEERLVGKKVKKTTLTLTEPGDRTAATTTRMSFTSKENGAEIYFLNFMVFADLGCMSKYDGKATILFEDGETLELTQISDTDCSDTANATYLIVPRNVYEEGNMESFNIVQNQSLKMLENKNVSKIRITGTKFFKNIELRPGINDLFKKMIIEIANLKEG
jgi:hypothetical protein